MKTNDRYAQEVFDGLFSDLESQPPVNAVDNSNPFAPSTFRLLQNHPNPFNTSTTIRFFLPLSGRVCLEVYNISGRHVETLIDEDRAAGSYAVVWNADGLPSSVYLCRLKIGDFVETKKLIYQK